MKCKMTERSKQIFGNDIAPGAYKNSPVKAEIYP